MNLECSSLDYLCHMFIYADLSKTGHDHFLFNTGYFTVLRSICAGEEVDLYCHGSHFKYIKDELDLEKVQQHDIFIQKRKGKRVVFLLEWLYKNIYDFVILWKIFRQASKKEARFVFFAMMPVRSMNYMLLLHRMFFRKLQVILTFHGEIEVWFNTHKTATQRFHSSVFKKLFAYSNRNLKFFVPNAFIRENLRKEQLFTKKEILTVYHLLHPDDDTMELKLPVIAGHIGSTEWRKHSDCFFKLATVVKSKFPDVAEKMKFRVAGRYRKDFDGMLEGSEVQLADQSRILERQYFDQEIKSLHFSMVFMFPDEYLYRESGTVLESLKFGKPVIGLKHPYLDFLEARYGKIGVYAENIESLAEELSRLFSDPARLRASYEAMCANIQNMHHQITLEQLARALKEQMQQAGISVP